VNLWFVSEFWEEEKEFRADLMKPISCCVNFWTNIFVTLLYLFFVNYYSLSKFITNKLHLSVCW
jgi:hypothetical protein